MLAGFKKFLMRGNVLDLAVAVVIGAAFTKIVNAVVDDIIMPLVTAIFGKPTYNDLNFTVNKAEFGVGNLVAAIVSFFCVAAAIYFLIIAPVNAMNERRKAKSDHGEKPAEPTEVELLSDIRDLLQAQRSR